VDKKQSRDYRKASLLVRRRWLNIGVMSVSIGMASQAAAGLIGSSYNLRLTGPVADGATTSTEQYSANGLVYDAAVHKPLPNTISPTPAPNPFTSTTNRVNRVVEPTGGNSTTGTATIWIKGPLNDPNNNFVNDLDLTKLVELELSSLKWDNLLPGQKIVVTDFQLDKGLFYDPVSVSYSGTGSVADPLSILARFSPVDVNRGAGNFVKVQFDFSTMSIPIPEPACMTLAGLSCLGVVGIARRRHRR
jgi:hypothetical protein